MAAAPLTRPAGLALVGSIARLLNAGLGADAAVAGVAEALRAGLAARSVVIALQEPGGAPHTVRSPREDDAVTPELPPPALAVRVPLEHEGIRLGTLEVTPGAGEPDGDVLAIAADLLAPFLASLALSRDLAVAVAAQSREIEEQRRFTSLVIDSLPVGLYVVDREYRIQIWNRKRETGTQGLRRDDVVGRPVFDVLTRQPAEQLRAEFDRVFETGEVWQSELEVGQPPRARLFRLSKIPMRLGGDEITHVITIGEDVTEWRAVQGQILQAEKLAAIGQLVAGVMHEINNPLATIGACAAALDAGLGDLPGPARAAATEYLEIIEKEVERCGGIVSRLLDFSRPKGTARQPVALNRLARDTLLLLKHHQRFKSVAVRCELDPADPVALGSGEQLTQVLMALLLNAMDAVADGGGLVVRTRRPGGRPDQVVLEVEDDGAGMSVAEQARIFEPFYTTKPPGRGTGLGLSICYGIVEAHRGRVQVESQPGRGSVFRVHLPAAP